MTGKSVALSGVTAHKSILAIRKNWCWICSVCAISVSNPLPIFYPRFLEWPSQSVRMGVEVGFPILSGSGCQEACYEVFNDLLPW